MPKKGSYVIGPSGRKIKVGGPTWNTLSVSEREKLAPAEPKKPKAKAKSRVKAKASKVQSLPQKPSILKGIQQLFPPSSLPLPPPPSSPVCSHKSKLTIKDAINRLKAVHYLGYQGQVTWALIINNYPPTKEHLEDEDLHAAADICLEVVQYLRHWLSDENLNAMEQTTINKYENVWPTLKDGVYYVDLNLREESHAFIVLIQGNTLTYAGGYGGRGLFSLKEFDRMEWQNLFNLANKGDLNAYAKAFVIDKAEINSVTFDDMRLYKSKKYT